MIPHDSYCDYNLLINSECMDNEKLKKIRNQMSEECREKLTILPGFFDFHVLEVERLAKILMEKLPDANQEVVLLGVYLHDLQRYRCLEGNHQEVGAREARNVMVEYGYGEEIIKQVEDIIRTHSCDKDKLPTSSEGQILSSADAMSHFYNDFYIRIATCRQRNSDEFKQWANEKLERDLNDKIFFDFARDMVKERYEVIKSFVNLG